MMVHLWADKHSHTLVSRNNLIELYEAWNKSEKAKEWRTGHEPLGSYGYYAETI